MKKILLLLIIAVLSVSSFTVIAETTQEATFVDMAEIFADKENWVSSAETKPLSFEGETAVFEPGTTIGYQGKEFTNEIYEFNVDFGDMEEGAKWVSFSFRGNSPNTHPMWNLSKAYSFLIRPTYVEFQARGKGTESLGIYPCEEIKNGETVRVKFGAFNLEKGIQIFLYINGKQVVNYYHRDADALKTGGYFSVYNVSNTVKITPVATKEAKKADPLVSEFEINEKENILELSHSTLFGDVEDISYGWYVSDKDIATVLVEDISKEGFYDNLKAVSTEKTLEISDEYAGKHIFAGVKTNDGIVFSNSYHYDIQSYNLKQAVYMLAQYEKMCVYGEFKLVDEDDDYITPDYFETDTLYVPLRASVEATGGSVEWDEVKRAVLIKSNNKETTINIGTLQGGLAKEPFIDSDRTFVAVSDLEKLLNIPVKVTDDGLIVLGDCDLADEALTEVAKTLEDYRFE